MLHNLKFNDQGLIPVITQQFDNKTVLMLAWMNEEAIKLTLEKKLVHYWSRSRKEIWLKGETSGNFQKLIEFRYDCDEDAILVLVDQKNGACHTGEYSCFFNKVK
jgi:phosphoribosyl-AMP cyclohydrolase